MNKWDIYWAVCKYEDKPDICEVRPVLIIEESYVTVLKITSKIHEERECDIKIKYWKEAGLKEPSSIRLDKRMRIPKEDFRDKIGRLESLDIKNLIEEYKKKF